MSPDMFRQRSYKQAVNGAVSPHNQRSKTMAGKFDIYQTVADRNIEAMDAGVKPWKRPFASAATLCNASTRLEAP